MKKERINAGILIINAFLALVCAIGIVYSTVYSELDMYYLVESMCAVVSILFTLIYLIHGFRKSYSEYYTAAMYINAFNAIVVSAVSINEAIRYIPTISCTLAFGCILVLAVAKDLGKTKSYVLSSIVVVCRVLGLSTLFVEGITPITLLVISQLVLAVIILICTIAKYNDKEIRKQK